MSLSSKIALGFWSAVLLCVALIVAAATHAFAPPVSIAVLIFAVVILVLAFVARGRAEQYAERQQNKRDAERYEELLQRIRTRRETVIIQGGSGVFMFLGMLVVTLATISGAVSDPGLFFISLSSILLLVTIATGCNALPLIGKPVLQISHQGLATPGYGAFRWQEIEGLDLTEVKSKGASVGHIFHLWVPQLTNRAIQMHPATRALHNFFQRGRARTRVRLSLNRTSESPDVILRLCKQLWAEGTGKMSIWSSTMTDATLAQCRHGEYQLEELKRAGELTATDPAAAMRILDSLEASRKAPADPEVSRRIADGAAEMKGLFDQHDPVTAMKIHRERSDARNRLHLEQQLAKPRRTHWSSWLVLGVLLLIVIARFATIL